VPLDGVKTANSSGAVRLGDVCEPDTKIAVEPSAATVELLSWLSVRTRTYDDAIEAWHSHCPRLTVWEDALIDGFIRITRGGDATSTVGLTERGGAALARAVSVR
jgi:hypothetical protein